MHHQKSIRTRLYHRGIPNSGSTGGPGAPGLSDVRMSQVHCTDQTASLETETAWNVSQTPSDSGFPRKRDLPVTASQVQGGKPLLPGQHIQGVVYPGKWVGIFRGRIIQLAIVNAEPGTAIFLLTKTTGDDHGLSLASIWPPVSISATHSSSFFIFWGDMRRGAQRMGGRSPLLMSCSTASV